MVSFHLDRKRVFILSINFLNYLFISLISSFLLDVQILRKFQSNLMIGLCYSVYSIGSLSVFLTPLITREFIRDLAINIANILSCAFSYLAIYSLYIASEVLLPISLFGLAFSVSIVDKMLSYSMVGDLSNRQRDNILTVNKFVINLTFAYGNTLSYFLYRRLGDDWKMMSVDYILKLSLGIFTAKNVLVFIYFFIYMYKVNVMRPPIAKINGESDHEPLDYRENSGNPYIPWIITINRAIYAIGSGLSVKFFVVYMVNKFGLKPSRISMVSITNSLILAFLVLIVKQMEEIIGGPLVIIIAKFVGFIFIICFILSEDLNLSIFCYNLRYPIQNCTHAITTAIMLYHTNKREYRWWFSSSELIAVINSSFSFVGGIISDKYGYKTCFVITCVLYAIAQCQFIPCLFLHKPKKDDQNHSQGDDL